MNPRIKRLYRVTATYAVSHGDPSSATYQRTWHYQDKRSAQRRRFLAEHGYSQGWSDGEPGSSIAIPPAEKVTFEVSEPIVWLPAIEAAAQLAVAR